MKKKNTLFICSSLIMLAFTIFTSGCKEQSPEPTVTTAPIKDITEESAISGGSISDEGSSTVYKKGVCWSTSPNPTTSDDKTEDGTNTGDFTSAITGLINGTTYYVRAYAKNSDATGYGNELSFVASPPILTPPCNPAQNSIRYHLENHTYSVAFAGTGGLTYGSYGITASNLSDLHIEFSHEPVSGKYLTMGGGGFIEYQQCSVSGTFGGTFSYHYIADEGDTVYVTKNGPGQYSITFCDLHFNGSNGDSFDSDGNLTTN
jgi:hypothetical protein